MTGCNHLVILMEAYADKRVAEIRWAQKQRWTSQEGSTTMADGSRKKNDKTKNMKNHTNCLKNRIFR